MSKADPSPSPHPGLSRPWRIAGVLLLFVVLGLSFLGYLTPDMRVEWENFVALCGFSS